MGDAQDSEDEIEQDKILSKEQREAKNLFFAREFLLVHSERTEILYILQTALLPQISLMKELLKQNATDRDRDCSEGVYDGTNSIWRSRMLDLHVSAMKRDGLFWKCKDDVATTLLEKSKWMHLPQTEVVSTLIVRHVLRPAAVLHDWLIRPLQQWPYRWLVCTEHLEHVHELLREAIEKPCMLDSFSRQLVQRVQDNEIPVNDLPLVVGTAALHMIGNTYAVEQMHSCNARRARRRVHAKAMQVFDLAMWLQSHNAFPWLEHGPDTKVSSSVYCCWGVTSM